MINSWDPIDAPQNHVIISIPSVLDPTMAPPGCHTLHAYAAANEPYDLYEPFSSNAKYQARNVFNIYTHDVRTYVSIYDQYLCYNIANIYLFFLLVCVVLLPVHLETQRGAM